MYMIRCYWLLKHHCVRWWYCVSLPVNVKTKGRNPCSCNCRAWHQACIFLLSSDDLSCDCKPQNPQLQWDKFWFQSSHTVSSQKECLVPFHILCLPNPSETIINNVYSFSLPSKPVNALLYLDSSAKSSTAAGTKQSEHGQVNPT